MIPLLLPWTTGLGRAGADATATAAATHTPWLQPRVWELCAPPGPETAVAALASAGAGPALVWTGAGSLDPTGLDPAGLSDLPAAVATNPDGADPGGFSLDLIWAPDASALATVWHDSATRLTPADLWPHQRLILAFPLALRRLSPERRLHDRQRLPALWQRRQPLASPEEALTPEVIEEAIRRRDPELLARAWDWLLALPDPADHWGLGLRLWIAAGRRWPWTPPTMAVAQQPPEDRLLLLQALQAGWLKHPQQLPSLLRAVPQEQRALHNLRRFHPHAGACGTVLKALPCLAVTDRGPLQAATLATATSLRFPAFSWADLNAADPAGLHSLTERLQQALRQGKPFSIVRLGDGEGVFLAGERPCVGGATINGSRRDPRLTPDGHLPDNLHRALIDHFLQAIEGADVVGVPDLSQCLTGPRHYPRVLANLWRALPPPRQTAIAPRVLPGGCHLHLYWLANGCYEHPPFNSVHGVIAPLLPPRLAGHAAWQPIPGEHGHHAAGEGPAHFPFIYEETLAWIARQAAPGRLFLVGAGILGKIYCDAIRQRGGVAVDVGSVMDLCGGLIHSRGVARLNPFLVPLAARAFPQAAVTG
jgi:hypothetical protein